MNNAVDSAEDGSDCREENNTIAFVFSPSMGGGSNVCGYCQHDENGTCVADVSCDNGCPGNKPMKGDNGVCYFCSSSKPLVVDASECAKCSNRYLTSAGKCVLCNTSSSAAADASECARCPNRSMQDGLCVRDRCPDGQFMYVLSNYSGCMSCNDSYGQTANATECAKCPNRKMTEDGKCVLK